ncbi:MAG: PAS domain S-box protein [Candidatus Aminicenantes bacterium]|nr:PAS domain S-box protein [Candidatus Aminicenantes bacterium]
MESALRDSGIKILGPVPWGTHFCQFYETRKDLRDILVPYFKAGLKKNEFCMWICSDPLGVPEAKQALRKAVPDLDRRIKKGQIEILPHTAWYLKGGKFSSRRVLRGWVDKLENALAKGFEGLRLSGNTLWLEDKDWQAFADYENEVNTIISRYPMMALCTYSLAKCRVQEVIDVLETHQRALVRRAGKWTVVESTSKNEIFARNEELATTVDKLEHSESLLRNVLDTLPIGVWITDRDGRIILGNPASRQIWAGARDVGPDRYGEYKGWWADTGKPIRPEEWAAARAVTKGETSINEDIEIECFDGTHKFILNSALPVRDAGGAITGAIIINQDVTRRRQGEERNKRQAALLDLAHEAILVRDAEDRIVFWNNGARDLYGWTREEVSGQVIHSFLKTRFPEPLARIREELAKTGHWDGVLVHSRKDGQSIVVESRWAPILGKDGKPAAVLEINRDITERKTADDALRRASSYTRSLIEASLDPLVTISPEGKIRDVNKATEFATGVSRERLIGSDFSDYFTDPRKAREGYQEVFMRGTVRDYPLAIRHVSGKVMDVVYNATIYRNEAGEVEGVFAAARDVTERLIAEQERLRLATAVEQVAEGISILDLEGYILYANPAFKSQHGPLHQEILGRSLRDILRLDPNDQETSVKFRQALEAGSVWNWHLTQQKLDGKVRELDLSVSPIRDGSGRLINSVAVSRDVTQEVQLQERIRQWQKMEALGTLAGGIAHDFNNILVPILINTELTLNEEKDNTPTAHRLSQVLEAARRGKDLVRQIITFAQQREQERKPVDIIPVIKDSLKLLRISMPTNIEITEKIETGSAVAVADPTQIQQVILNLGSNAAHAMREKGGTLEVALSEESIDAKTASRFIDLKPGSYLRLSARDTGHGMPPEVMGRIFEPFFTTKKQGEGTGMGLAVVHGIVKSHGGAITAVSDIGKGTIFTIYLPRVSGAAATVKESREPYPKGTERILFVDDENIQVRAMHKLLEHLGYSVVGLTDSVEALETFRRLPGAFDLAIMDQTMPRLSGGELAREMLRIRPDLPVILCTGYSESLNEEQALAVGIKAFVMKPFSVKEIAESIRRVLTS